MRKIISLVLLTVLLITISTVAFATNSVLGDDNNNVTQIPKNEYENAQNNVLGTTTNNNTNNSTLPQTGIQDSGLGILLVVCIASAIFAFKKVSDYKNI